MISVAQIVDGSVALRPYVPRLLIQWLLEAPGTIVREIDGSVVFVDVSGFTSMSERLARRGKEGAEEVTDVIGAVFGRLLSIAYGSGGGLIKFGGDALLLLFTGDDHPGKAARAAVGMRRTLREIGKLDTSAGKVRLRMSGGIHSGTFHAFLVGDGHRELLLAGPAASRTVAMESIAAAGEVVVSPETAAQLPGKALGEPKAHGILLRREPTGPSLDSVETEVALAGVDVMSCIPVGLREHLLAGSSEPEHRTVTVAFVHFDGIDALMADQGADAVAFGLQELMTSVQRSAEKHGVPILGTDIDADGGKIILVSGAPQAQGEDEERMLLTLREILDAETAVPVRIGVNRGPVFAGDIGPPFRRTYTVMGDAVNLAARVMGMAIPGQILATGPVLDASAIAFNAMALDPFTVKGKREPVHAFMVGHPTGAKTADTSREFPLVGRDAEMEAIRRALLEVRAGHGSLLELVGNAGMGKTRLLSEFRAEAADVPQLAAGCELYEASVPYLPFRRLLRLLLGIPTGHDASTLAERLRRTVADRAPDLLPWLPLLATVVDVEVEPTPEVGDLGEEFRKPKLEEVTGELLARLLTGSTLIAIEDVHWMDEASADLLRHIAARIADLPWLVCVTRRDEDTGFVAPSIGRCVSMQLSPLSSDSVSELIELGTTETPLLPHVVQELGDRSAGNPLFLQELVHAVKRAGSLEHVPASIEGMVTAQIDRLPANDRRILRYAAVLGTSFDEGLLTTLLTDRDAVTDRSIWRRLSDFVADEGGGTYRFHHALMRDAAYEGLSYRRRRELHARVGMGILGAAGANPDDRAELLSTHFFLAGELEPALRFSVVAANRAATVYANVEASRFFRRAIDAARRLDLPADELRPLHEGLGDALERAGLYREAGRAFGDARRLGREAPVAAARLMLKQAQIEDRAGSPSVGLRWLSRAMRILDDPEDQEMVAQRARVSAEYGAIRSGQGRDRETIRWCERAIAEAEESGEPEPLGRAHYLLAWTTLNRGDPGATAHLERALEVFERIGDLRRQGDVLQAFGAAAYWEGRWSEAVELYQRGSERFGRAGDTIGAAIAWLNVAEILSDRGLLEESDALASDALRVFRAADFREQAAYVLSILGRTASRAGRHEEATGHLEEALRLGRDAGEQRFEVAASGFLAEAAVRRGDAEAALELVERASARGALIGGPGIYEALLERTRGCALIMLGDLRGAADALDRSLAAARATRSEYDEALAFHAMAWLSEETGDTGPASGGAGVAATVFERLGVVGADVIGPRPRAVSV